VPLAYQVGLEQRVLKERRGESRKKQQQQHRLCQPYIKHRTQIRHNIKHSEDHKSREKRKTPQYIRKILHTQSQQEQSTAE
jgi:hypothetical protein